jgi:hypothetical protein
MSMTRSPVARLGGAAVAVAFLAAGQAPGQQNLSRDGYENVKTLKDAVEVVKGQLKADGKPEYAALVTEARMREAIRTAVQSYESLLEKLEKGSPGSTKNGRRTSSPSA